MLMCKAEGSSAKGLNKERREKGGFEYERARYENVPLICTFTFHIRSPTKGHKSTFIVLNPWPPSRIA